MKRLSRIRLINWHRFRDVDMPVNGALVIVGENRVGKSTIIDALQVGLVGDATKVRLNNAASQKASSDRNLLSYVLGRINFTKGDPRSHRLLRPEGCTSYVLLEFCEEDHSNTFVLGVVMEATATGSVHKEHFVAHAGMKIEDLRLHDESGCVMKLQDFRRSVKGMPKIRWYDQVTHYRDAVRQQCGRPGNDYMRVFVQGVSLKDISNVRSFAINTLLDQDAEIEIGALRETIEHYTEMTGMADDARARIASLTRILEEGKEAKRLFDERDLYLFLVARAKVGKQQELADELERQLPAVQAEKYAGETAYEAALEHTATAVEVHSEAQRRLAEHSAYHDYTYLTETIARLKEEIKRHRRDMEILEAVKEVVSILMGHLRQLDPEEIPKELLPTDAEMDFLGKLLSALREILVGNLPHTEEELSDMAAKAETIIKGISDRFRERVAIFSESERQLNTRRSEMEEELEGLKEGVRKYPYSTEILRALISERLGVKADVFCELIEIADDSWRDALEGFLDSKRFDLIVGPGDFDRALSLYESEKRRHTIEGVGLVNTRKMLDEYKPAQPESLAAIADAKNEIARAYLDSIAGTMIRCDNEQQLKLHRRSITRTVMVYQNHVARQKRFEIFERKFIGRKGLDLLRAQLEAEIRKNTDTWRKIHSQSVVLKAVADMAEKALPCPHEFLRHKNAPITHRDAVNELASCQARFQALDMGDIDRLKRDVKDAEDAVNVARDREKKAYGEVIRLNASEQEIQSSLRETRGQEQAAMASLEIEYPEDHPLRATREQEYSRLRAEGRENDRIIANYYNQSKNRDTDGGKHRDEMIRLCSAYDTNHHFSTSGSGIDTIPAYSSEKQRWEETELPKYLKDARQARENALHLLQEDVIHNLREKMLRANHQFDELNKALRKVDFSGCTYKFIIEPKSDPEIADFYGMIMDAGKYDDAPLLQTPWKEQNEDRLQDMVDEILADRGKSSIADLQRHTDYRNYFDYDVEVTEIATKERTLLSKLSGAGCGGEKTTPFYVAMLASTARVCRTREEGSRIALAAFDEAFDKLDDAHPRGIIELGQKLRIQMVLAAPTVRINTILAPLDSYSCYLVHRGENDEVYVEPFTKEQLADPEKLNEIASSETEEEEGEIAPSEESPALVEGK